MGDGGLEDIGQLGVEDVVEHIGGGHFIPEGQAGEAGGAYLQREIISSEAEVPHLGLGLTLLLPLLPLLLLALLPLPYHLLQDLPDRAALIPLCCFVLLFLLRSHCELGRRFLPFF